MTSDIGELLDERRLTHGYFEHVADLSQGLKDTMSQWSLSWGTLEPHHKEALEMICLKMARIVNGNPNFADHWDDIAGYATLVSDGIKDEPTKTGDDNDQTQNND